MQYFLLKLIGDNGVLCSAVTNMMEDNKALDEVNDNLIASIENITGAIQNTIVRINDHEERIAALEKKIANMMFIDNTKKKH